MLKSDDENKRKSAEDAIIEMNDISVIEPLLAVYNDDTYDIIRIADIFGHFKDPRTVEPLITKLNHRYDVVRKSAAQSLGIIKDKRAIEPLISALNDNDYSVKEAASLSLVWITKQSFGTNYSLWINWWKTTDH